MCKILQYNILQRRFQNQRPTYRYAKICQDADKLASTSSSGPARPSPPREVKKNNLEGPRLSDGRICSLFSNVFQQLLHYSLQYIIYYHIIHVFGIYINIYIQNITKVYIHAYHYISHHIPLEAEMQKKVSFATAASPYLRFCNLTQILRIQSIIILYIFILFFCVCRQSRFSSCYRNVTGSGFPRLCLQTGM